MAQFGEEDGGRTVEKEDEAAIDDQVRKARVTHRGRDTARKGDHTGQEQGTNAEDRHERIGEDLPGVGTFFAGVPEATGLQAQGEDDLQHGDIGHEFGHDPEIGLGQDAGVKRDEREIDDPGQDGTQAVNGGFAGKLFDRIGHLGWI